MGRDSVINGHIIETQNVSFSLLFSCELQGFFFSPLSFLICLFLFYLFLPLREVGCSSYCELWSQTIQV